MLKGEPPWLRVRLQGSRMSRHGSRVSLHGCRVSYNGSRVGLMRECEVELITSSPLSHACRHSPPCHRRRHHRHQLTCCCNHQRRHCHAGRPCQQLLSEPPTPPLLPALLLPVATSPMPAVPATPPWPASSPSPAPVPTEQTPSSPPPLRSLYQESRNICLECQKLSS
jgi:hypothetical protein